MRNIVRISEGALREVARVSSGRRTSRDWPVGVSRLPRLTEWLVHQRPVGGNGPLTGPTLRLITESELGSGHHKLPAWSRPGDPVGMLTVGVGPAAGQFAGSMRGADDEWIIHGVRMVGPGMPFAGPDIEPEGAEDGPGLPASEVWSRSIGALGEKAWSRLTTLPVCLVGCGRTGGMVAASLARLGVRRLALVDPDRIEAHNLGEMEALASDLGRLKSNAVAEGLVRSAVAAPPLLDPVGEPVLSLSALRAIKESELVVCAVDNPAARLVAAYLASAYLRPLLDLGTGILLAPGSGGGPKGRQLGLDVRLVLPGRCLLCAGGIAGLRRGRAELLAPGPAAPADWRQERAGSLRSLNALAANLGVRLWEDLVAGRLRGTTWLSLDYDEAGIPSLRHREAELVDGCPLCAITGLGDDSIPRFRGFLNAL